MSQFTKMGTDVTAIREKVHEALQALQKTKPDGMFDEDVISMLPCMRDLCRKDPDLLVAVVNQFLALSIFKTNKLSDGGFAFKLRDKEDYEKYQKLDEYQTMVYEQIEESGGDGIWLKIIRQRTNMHESAVNHAIKQLTSMGLISELKNVANSNRRIFIKVGVAQSERSSGGPWYTDGELDEAFIATITNVLYNKILTDSMQLSKAGRHAMDRFQRKQMEAKARLEKEQQRAKQPKKGVKSVNSADAADAEALRNRALGPLEKQAAEMMEYKMQRTLYDEFVHYPAGYIDYPKIDPLTLWVMESKVCHESVVLTTAEVGVVLDIMVLDKKIEEVDCGAYGIGYKVTRQSLKPMQDAFNVFTEAPCGRCPVFDLCEEGGPVGPSNCEYFNKWLGV